MKINQTDVLRSNCPNHIIFLFSFSFITQFFLHWYKARFSIDYSYNFTSISFLNGPDV